MPADRTLLLEVLEISSDLGSAVRISSESAIQRQVSAEAVSRQETCDTRPNSAGLVSIGSIEEKRKKRPGLAFLEMAFAVSQVNRYGQQ